MSKDFTDRLSRAFGYGTMADIARQLGLPHATIRNYFLGRLPAPEVLIKIANETNVSLNWLLTGKGEIYVSGATADIGRLIDERIDELITRKLSQRTDVVAQEPVTATSSKAFDIESAVNLYGDPERVMREWFDHDGLSYPADFGIVFFQGWESYTPAERVEAVRDARKVLDRTLRNRSAKK